MRRFLFVALALGSAACAAVLGIEGVSYDDALGDGGAETGGGDGGTADAPQVCTGPTCGARCCDKGATCTDGGACSNDVVQVSGGGNGSCALVAGGTVWCWGENALGQLGLGDGGGDMLCTFKFNDGANVASDPCRHVATRVPGLPPAIAIGAGFQVACAAAESSDGGVWCWGRNASGVLGHDPSIDPLCSDVGRLEDGGPFQTPCNATPQQVPGIIGVIELAVSDTSACARTRAGEVFCWGEGRSGQLGNDAGESSPTPVKVLGLPSDIVQLGTGLYAQAMCAVSAGGRGFCWGGNVPEEPGTLTARPVAGGRGTPLTDLVEIRLGLTNICARRKDGEVICWGGNDNSQLGRDHCDLDGGHPYETVINLPRSAGLDGRWLHSCAVDEQGKVRCWGVAQDGALGQGTIVGPNRCGTVRPLYSSGPTEPVPNLPKIAKLATGIETTFAIDVDGKLWAWGANDIARLGHPPKTQDDLFNCGDMANQTTCNPKPRRVEGLPP